MIFHRTDRRTMNYQTKVLKGYKNTESARGHLMFFFHFFLNVFSSLGCVSRTMHNRKRGRQLRFQLSLHRKAQCCWKRGAGGRSSPPPPYFYKSVNPISTGGRLYPLHLYPPPPTPHRFSDLPTVLESK